MDEERKGYKDFALLDAGYADCANMNYQKESEYSSCLQNEFWRVSLT